MNVPVTFPVLLRNKVDGNSACIKQVRSNGRASENWTFSLKCPTLIEGISPLELHRLEVDKSKIAK